MKTLRERTEQALEELLEVAAKSDKASRAARNELSPVLFDEHDENTPGVKELNTFIETLRKYLDNT